MTPISGDYKSNASATLEPSFTASFRGTPVEPMEVIPDTGPKAINELTLSNNFGKLFRCLKSRFPNQKFGNIYGLLLHIERYKEQWSSQSRSRPYWVSKAPGYDRAAISIIGGEIILFFDLKMSTETSYNTVQFAYNYTTHQPLVLLRVKRQSDDYSMRFNQESRPLKVTTFNNALKWYDQLNSLDGLVNTLAIVKLQGLTTSFSEDTGPYEEEFGMVQPAYTGDLKKYVFKEIASEKNLIHIFRDVLRGLRTVHEKGLAHRDIKLDNILYKTSADTGDVTAAITDFGFVVAADSPPDWLCKKLGKECYWSPEFWKLQPPMTIVDHQSADMWATGILLYQLLMKTDPFWIAEYRQMRDSECDDMRKLSRQLVWLGSSNSNLQRFSKWRESLSKEGPFWPVIKGLLDPQPETRLTAAKADELFNRLISRNASSHSSEEAGGSDCKESKSMDQSQAATLLGRLSLNNASEAASSNLPLE